MLVLGISIGVAFNVMFPDWMVTVLLIILFLGTSTKALFKGIETWKKESLMKKEATKMLASSSNLEGAEQEYNPIPGGPGANMQLKSSMDDEVPLKDNIFWKELMVLLFVWVAFLAVQIIKTYATTCSVEYWILNVLQEITFQILTLTPVDPNPPTPQTVESRSSSSTTYDFLNDQLNNAIPRIYLKIYIRVVEQYDIYRPFVININDTSSNVNGMFSCQARSRSS